MSISTHFALAEFQCHNGKNAPPSSIPALQTLCRLALEPLRVRYGAVRIISGYRTEAYNRSIGGAPDSRHVYDKHLDSPAVDLSCRLGQPRDWYDHLDTLGVGGLGLYAGHVHVDLRKGRARW